MLEGLGVPGSSSSIPKAATRIRSPETRNPETLLIIPARLGPYTCGNPKRNSLVRTLVIPLGKLCNTEETRSRNPGPINPNLGRMVRNPNKDPRFLNQVPMSPQARRLRSPTASEQHKRDGLWVRQVGFRGSGFRGLGCSIEGLRLRYDAVRM